MRPASLTLALSLGEREPDWLPLRPGEKGVGGILPFFAFAGEADAGEPFAGGEDDAPVFVVVGFAFVLLHDGELNAVDGDEFVEGEAEGHGGEDVDFDEGLAAGVVGAEGAVRCQVGVRWVKKLLVEAGVGFAPGVVGEGGVEGVGPEVGVVGGEAVEGEGAEAELGFRWKGSGIRGSRRKILIFDVPFQLI
jgi:hypothetical protein